MENKISVHNLKKNFGKLEVLKDISIEIREGEVVCMIGPSGSGKSTFLRCGKGEAQSPGNFITDNRVILKAGNCLSCYNGQNRGAEQRYHGHLQGDSQSLKK